MLISHAKQGNAQNLSSKALAVCKLPDAQAGFRKGRGTRDQVANICWIIEKAREFQKKLSMPKPLTVRITQTGKFFKRWEYQTTLPVS